MNHTATIAGKTVPVHKTRADTLRVELNCQQNALEEARVGWGRIGLARFNPARRSPSVFPASTFNILYVGELSSENGLDIVAESFLIARERDVRLHLVLVGRGPSEDQVRARLGKSATFFRWIEDDQLARMYASADLFVSASSTGRARQAILEAQASGLAVLAVDTGGHAELIENGRSGCLVPADPEVIATALRRLAHREALRARLATGGLLAVHGALGSGG